MAHKAYFGILLSLVVCVLFSTPAAATATQPKLGTSPPISESMGSGSAPHPSTISADLSPTDQQGFLGNLSDPTREALQAKRQKEIRELAAQESMATTARWAFWATVGQAAIGLFGFLMLILTIRQGGDTLAIARDSLSMTIDGQRPWVQPEINLTGTVKAESGVVQAQLSVALNNRGKVPARNTRFAIVGVRKKRAAPANLDPTWTAVHEIIKVQERENMGHVVFPSKPCELSPLLTFMPVDELVGADDPFDLIFVTLTTYDWSLPGGGTALGSTTVVGGLGPGGIGSSFDPKQVTTGRGCRAKAFHFMGDDHYQ